MHGNCCSKVKRSGSQTPCQDGQAAAMVCHGCSTLFIAVAVMSEPCFVMCSNKAETLCSFPGAAEAQLRQLQAEVLTLVTYDLVSKVDLEQLVE